MSSIQPGQEILSTEKLKPGVRNALNMADISLGYKYLLISKTLEKQW